MSPSALALAVALGIAGAEALSHTNGLDPAIAIAPDLARGLSLALDLCSCSSGSLGNGLALIV